MGENFTEKIMQLAFQVQQKVGQPMNVKVTQAIIESFGIREIDVPLDYKMRSMAELSENVHAKILERTIKKEIPLEEYSDNKMTKKDFIVFAKNYFLGIFYVLPIFFQVLCVILFGYSLWVYSDFNILQSTSVVLGVISSLILTGGVITVISKQISFYWNHENKKMVFQTTVYLLKSGFQFLIFANFVFVLLAYLLDYFSIEMALLSAVYSIIIGIALLFIAPLYVVKERFIIPISIIAGSVVSLFLKFFTDIYIYFTHWIGIAVVILVLVFYLLKYFRRNNSLDKKFKYNEVKNEFVLYNNYIYFFYGSLFFLFVFLDRILAWSVHEKERFLYFIFFEKDYEIGMDIALLSYLLVAGVFEFSISKFANMLDVLQTKVSVNNIKHYGDLFIKKYNQNLMILFLTSCVAFAIQLFLIYSPYGYDAYFEDKLNDTSRMVCILGSLGYFFFAWGVLNVLHFFTLGQPILPLKAILYATVINVMVGLFFSRYFSYHLSVIGFFIGSLFFMMYTTLHLRIYFKKMDYYYYAAF